jgi:hypothetical protein
MTWLVVFFTMLLVVLAMAVGVIFRAQADRRFLWRHRQSGNREGMLDLRR